MSSSNNLPHISVVIPTFNRLRFVLEAVESVILQTYPYWELLVIDDGSEDSTYKVLQEKYGHDNRIRILKNSENKGVSYSRNRGIQEAQYSWIAFLDSDDLWMKRKLAQQVKRVSQTGHLVCHTQEKWYRRGEFINQKKHHKKYGGRFFEKALPLCLISPSSVLIHKVVFETIGLFDESFEVCEDYEMWLRLTLLFEVDFLEEPFLIKRGGHEDQLSHKYYGMDRWRIRAMEKLLKQYADILTDEQKFQVYREIVKKAKIYAQGALKRKKEEEAQRYLSKVAFYQKLMKRF